MDFHLTREQEMVRKMYREFAENEVKPLAEELDEEERFPMETVEKMGKLGMMGIYFPKKYGGAGGDVLSYAMCVEELSKVCGTTGVIVSAHTSLCCAPIYEHGTEEQKMKYLPDLLSGKKIGAFGLTEPNAGTDASGQQTTAVKNENGDYVLNGSKCFITNGTVASTIVVFAMTDQKAGNHGISAFIVESSFPGFSVGKKEKHEPYSVDAAMAKLFAAESASDVTRRAVQLFGGYGYTREYPVERMMSDAKITEIYEGTSEVQRMVISRALGVK